ncbi:MAG TPA: glycosyltransferase [Blastocatellia bacterium]|nr:glycosyltransferase [Blastocatellia bacterium]
MSEKHYQIELPRRLLQRRTHYVESATNTALAPQRLLYIAYQFAPSLEMGARSCVQIARHLPAYGWSPVVLTIDEKYVEGQYLGRIDEVAQLGLPDEVVRTRLLPHPFDLYRWLKASRSGNSQRGRENRGDATSIEVDAPLRAKNRLRRFLISTLSIPDLCTGWIFPAVIAGLKAARRSGAQQLFSSGPFWSNHLVGFALSYLTGLPWTAHFRDPWVAGAPEKPASAISAKINEWLERIIVTRASAVISVTEEHSDTFRSVYPFLSPGKFITVPNGYDSDEWENLPADIQADEKSKEKFLITYAGTFYIERDPQPLFRAIKSLIDDGEIGRDQIQVDLIGWCDTSEGRSVREMADECGVCDCINILGPRSRPETLYRMSQANLLLLLAERFVIQIPGKTYEYLRAGRPILALTSKGALANFLRRIGGGWVVDPKDDAGIVSALKESVRQWKQGRQGRVADQSLVAGFDRRVLAGQLTKLFDRISAQSKRIASVQRTQTTRKPK